MRVKIEIDDRLVRQAIRASGAATKEAVVQDALRLLLQTKGQSRIRHLRGKVAWKDHLNGSRRDRYPT